MSVVLPPGRAADPPPGAAPRRLLAEARMKMRSLLLAAACLAAAGVSALAADWPQWRGPDPTDVSKGTGLLKAWAKGGPPLLWKFNQPGTGLPPPPPRGAPPATLA